MRLLRDPVWRRSPVVLVRHYPAYAVALLVGTAALAVSVLSGRPFLDAADVALTQQQLASVPATAPSDEQGRVRASLAVRTPPRVEAAVTDAMDGLAGGGPAVEVRRPTFYFNPVLQLSPNVVATATGDRTPSVIFSASGAIESLVPAPGSPEPDGTGLWVSDTVADRLGLAPGDPVGVQLAPPGQDPPAEPATLTGVYLTDGRGVPRDPTGLWERLDAELPPWPSHLEHGDDQLPLLVLDRDTYRRMDRAIGEITVVTWDVSPEAERPRLADLVRLAESVATLQDELDDRYSDVGEQVDTPAGNPVQLATGLTDMSVATRGGLDATRDGVAAVRVLAAGLSWLVVLLGVVALLVRRRGEHQVLVDQGRSSLSLGALTVVESLLPAGVGLALGWWASEPFASAVVGGDGADPRRLDAGLVGVVVLATVAVTAVTTAWLAHRRTSGRTVVSASRLPWRSAVLAATVAGAVSAYRGDEGFDAVTAVFPLAAVGSAAILLSTVASLLLARLAVRWLPRRLGPRLTLSRLARDRAAATAFLAATVASGAVGYGLLFHVSVEEAAATKVAAAVGASSVFSVSDAAAAADVADTVGDSTVVLSTVPRVEGYTGDRLVAVDPATFADAALWSPRFSGRDPADLLRDLHEADATDTLPVLLAGSDEHVPPTGTLERGDDFTVRYRVVDRIDGFTGFGRWATVLVVDQEALLSLAPPGAADDLEAGLWSDRDADTVGRAARAAGLSAKLEGTVATVRAEHPTLVARSWVTGYLQAFTVLALLLGLLVMAGLHRRDREQRRLQDATLADLGHPRGLASRAAGLELAAVSVLGAVAGGLAAYAVTSSLADRLDPLPALRPALTVTGSQQLVLAAAGFVVAALLLTLVSGRLGRARSVNELLHDE